MKKHFKRILSVSLMICLVVGLFTYTNADAATVKISKTKATLYTGDSTTLKISGTKKAVKWTSSKKSIATVSSKGKVTAKKEGSTTIIATVNSKKYTCKITVKEKLLSHTAEDIIDEFINANIDVDIVIVYDETTDPNNKLGRPNQYTSKASFSDSRLVQETYEGADPVGGTVEVFSNSADCKVRYDYIKAVASGSFLEQYMYQNKNALLRLDFGLTPSQAAEYEEVFNSIN